jgi:BlaI family transcriptional regulator, penicillinase repressor
MAKARRPTDAELAILRVLWDHGPSTVRQVAQVLGRERSYTTILKLLQIMADKGLVDRDEAARTHVYTATAGRGTTQKQLVADLLRRAFDGSASKLMMHALDVAQASPAELEEMRRLLDSTRKGKRR